MASSRSSAQESTDILRRVRSTGDIDIARHELPRPPMRVFGPDSQGYNSVSVEFAEQWPRSQVIGSSSAAERLLPSSSDRRDLPRASHAPRAHHHHHHHHRYSEGYDVFSPHRHLNRMHSELPALEPARPRVPVRDSGLSIRPMPSPVRIPVSPRGERTTIHWTDPATASMLGDSDPIADPYVPPADVTEPLPPNAPRYRKIMTFLGYGRYATKARKALVSIVWTLSFGFMQIVIVITLLGYAAHRRSPTMPQYDEWQACARPLGIWNALWVGKILMGCSMGVWGYTRDRTSRQNSALERQNVLSTAETGRTRGPYPQTEAANRAGAATRTVDNAASTGRSSHGGNNNEASTRPHARLFSRMSFLSSVLTLTWFVIAHILEYTSVNTCRHDAPHIWWLTFGILCIMYLTVVEVIVVGLVVFIFGPLIILFWNITLILLGRHPLQNPHYIKPEIGKLPKSVVERIPLVLYIPAPPDEDKASPLAIPAPVYTYPPKAPQNELVAPRRRRRRFAFLRKFTKSKGAKSNRKDGGNQDKSKDEDDEKDEVELAWEDNWEQGDYPFVRLEENRAACAICLLDFEEPKRIRGLADMGAKRESNSNTEARDSENGDTSGDEPIEELRVGEVTEEEREEILKLQDAGEGPQPLRLLACGHVFHKTCLDPWLTDVSGRCPVCQRPVQLPETSESKSKTGRGRSRGRQS